MTVTGSIVSLCLVAVPTLTGGSEKGGGAATVTASVRDDRPSDTALGQEVRHRLESHDLLGARSIEVTVQDGRVTLRGGVESEFEKTHAYFLAIVPGVVEIDNRLEVASGGRLSDEELRTSVERAFDRDPRFGTRRPYIDVEQGMVTLFGSVESRRAKEAASDVVRQVAGVHSLRNHLEIAGDGAADARP